MPEASFIKPVEDSIPKVDDSIAVGEDLEFQERWWRFERIVWTIFALIILLDVLGLFGRGWLARAGLQAADGTIRIKYERIERTMTPSVMKIQFGPRAIHDGHVQLFVTNSIIEQLGAQRIAPQPASSVLGNGGVTYTFPATAVPATVDISFMPQSPGIRWFTIEVPGADAVRATVVVVP